MAFEYQYRIKIPNSIEFFSCIYVFPNLIKIMILFRYSQESCIQAEATALSYLHAANDFCIVPLLCLHSKASFLSYEHVSITQPFVNPQTGATLARQT